MIVLGWHGALESEWERGGFGHAMHDSAAAIVADGEILAAVEEERLDRVKHSNNFPVRAISHCLSVAGVALSDLDYIALDLDEATADAIASRNFLNDPLTRDWFKSVRRPHQARTARDLYGSVFEKNFGVDVRGKLRFVKHHLAHAAAAYLLGDIDPALVVCLDGDGDGLSGLVARGSAGRLETLKEFSERQSLGAFYRTCIAFLGYNIFDEYKVMGLAPFGDPMKYRDTFSALFELLPGGDYTVADQDSIANVLIAAGFLPHVRAAGESFTTVHKDLAASIQWVLETVIFHVISYHQQQTRLSGICLGGGVAHNSTFNGRLYYSGMFSDIFVQPAAHDAGNAIGAALSIAQPISNRWFTRPVSKLPNLYLGTSVPQGEDLSERLAAWSSLVVRQQSAGVRDAAARLARGDVIAWVQGRAEFGPRALGNRSILADPRPAENKERINRMIKKREGYRPFAPSVKAEAMANYFEMLPGTAGDFRFMNFVVRVREPYRETLGAVTHVDGTARIQAVPADDNPRFWSLLSAFEDLTGLPILLNTSLNNNAEPIVDSVEDAVVFLVTSEVDSLFIDETLIERVFSPDINNVFEMMSIAVRPSHRIVASDRPENGKPCREYYIESNASVFFAKQQHAISHALFLLLLSDGSTTSIAEAKRTRDINVSTSALWEEIRDLLGRRALRLHPLAAIDPQAPSRGSE